MPLAGGSLRDRLEAAGGPLPLEEAIAALTDIAVALADLDGRVGTATSSRRTSY
jgi:hypothetical protein